MKTKDAIQLEGSQAALAKLLGISPSAISQWGENIPDTRIWQLKVLRAAWFKNNSPWDGVERRTGPADRRAQAKAA